jgi:hypothetical protein
MLAKYIVITYLIVCLSNLIFHHHPQNYVPSTYVNINIYAWVGIRCLLRHFHTVTFPQIWNYGKGGLKHLIARNYFFEVTPQNYGNLKKIVLCSLLQNHSSYVLRLCIPESLREPKKKKKRIAYSICLYPWDKRVTFLRFTLCNRMCPL